MDEQTEREREKRNELEHERERGREIDIKRERPHDSDNINKQTHIIPQPKQTLKNNPYHQTH